MLKRLFILVALVFISPPLLSDSTPNVPIEDPVYREIDKLMAVGLVKEVILSQRPWSRSEIARILARAIENRKEIPSEEARQTVWITIDRLLTKLQSRFRQELIDLGTLEGESPKIIIRPLETAQFDYTLLDSPSRLVPTSNGLGQIDATINPFVENQNGKHFVDGNSLRLETTHWVKLSKYFSLYAEPQVEALAPNTGSSDLNLLAQKLYGKVAYKNLELEVGRDELIWGQSPHGGLILSDNARPLDMLKAGTISPFYLPGFLKYVGPTTFQLFFADMGPEREFPHAILSGYRVSLLPVTFFEISLNHVVMMGGNGADDPTPMEAIGEYTGILSTATGNRHQGAFTNRLFSGEARVVIPPLRNSAFYVEAGFDDTNTEIDVLLQDDATYLTGFYIPRLSSSGSTDLRLEYRHIPALTYRHTQYLSGFTLNQKMLGANTGPDSDSATALLQIDLPDYYSYNLSVAYEWRDSDLFTTITEGSSILDILKRQDNPSEQRWRIQNNISKEIRNGLEAKIGFGYERVNDFGFVAGDDRNNLKLSFSLKLFPSLIQHSPSGRRR
ncbi:MAG: hypothetical protein HYT76_03975 [Deltaproteobacteria bacterium]|nr:hypothetical protein [Deltaproteobacteria bacterium]